MTVYINEYPPFWPAVVGIDIETTGYPYPPEEKAGLDPFKGHILSIAVSDGQDVWLILHWFGFDGLKDLLEDENIVKIFHNAQFDLAFIKLHLGVETQNIFDTMLAEQVLIAARDMQASLADALARRLGIMVYKETRESFFQHPGYHVQPITDEQVQYSANDVIYLPKLREAQLVEAEKDKCTWAIDIENNAVPAFTEIKLGGFKLDVDRWYEYVEIFKAEVTKSEAKLREMLGPEYVLRFMNKSETNPQEKVYTVENINFGSPDQLKNILLNPYRIKTKHTDEKTLLEISDALEDSDPARPFIDELLNCRHWKKCITWDYPAFIHSTEGKIYPDFHQIGTDTGRPSCANPNLLQIPKPIPSEPNFRQLWLADSEDCVLVSADYAQQEIRIMADLSKDSALITACNQKDVYLYIGSMMYNKEIKKGDPERQEAKIFALAIGFRVGLKQLRRQSRLSFKHCEKIRDIVLKTFPTMDTYAGLCEGFAKRNNYIFTVSGRHRYFTAKSRIYTEAVNTPVQGTATDMTKTALARVYKTLTEWKKSGIINTKARIWHFLYDEIVIQCHKDDVEKVTQMVTQTMEDAGRLLCPSVSHISEAHSGYRWDK